MLASGKGIPNRAHNLYEVPEGGEGIVFSKNHKGVYGGWRLRFGGAREVWGWTLGPRWHRDEVVPKERRTLYERHFADGVEDHGAHTPM